MPGVANLVRGRSVVRRRADRPSGCGISDAGEIRSARIRPAMDPSPDYAEFIAPGVNHACAVSAAGVDASSSEAQQTLDFGVDG